MSQRRVEDTPKGRRKLIGLGEEADIYLYLDGMLKDKVGRVQRGEEHYEPRTEKNNLMRYRRHQIAYLLFPQYNLNVVGVDLSDKELLSMQVIRSKSNLKDATSTGVRKRNERAKRDLPKEAIAPLMEMQKAGVVVHTGVVNVSVSDSGIKFFEVDAILPDLARKHLTEHDYPQHTVEKGMLLIEALELETKLSDIDLHFLFREPQERSQILKKHKKEHLETLYSQEIGSTITAEG
ncbi:MAG: hypothetical protein KKD39_02285 [Candidatus Altiarchaeota archaeon]|nr:hypothetical protein [Candidatus Altiarchaeota archaeon]